MSRNFQALKRKQLDEKLGDFRGRRAPEVPRGGWAKAIRTALGMPSEALGKRIGVTQSAVIQLEKSEEAQTITIASLEKLANGLECDLVYVLIPRTSLQHTVESQAQHRAESMVRAVSSSMELEAQGISKEERERQIRSLARDLITKPGSGFWDDV